MLMEKIENRLQITEREQEQFLRFGSDYSIDGCLFIKDDIKYSYIIKMNQEGKIEYILKEGRKYILKSKSIKTILNKIRKILGEK